MSHSLLLGKLYVDIQGTSRTTMHATSTVLRTLFILLLVYFFFISFCLFVYYLLKNSDQNSRGFDPGYSTLYGEYYSTISVYNLEKYCVYFLTLMTLFSNECKLWSLKNNTQVLHYLKFILVQIPFIRQVKIIKWLQAHWVNLLSPQCRTFYCNNTD